MFAGVAGAESSKPRAALPGASPNLRPGHPNTRVLKEGEVGIDD
jgi:hypothetical protein